MAPAFVLGGVTLQTAMVPIAPNMQTPVTLTLSGYQAGITGACVGGLSGCLYFSDPGLLKIQIEMSVSAVPEPSTGALLALGLAGIWIAGYRRRQIA